MMLFEILRSQSTTEWLHAKFSDEQLFFFDDESDKINMKSSICDVGHKKTLQLRNNILGHDKYLSEIQP